MSLEQDAIDALREAAEKSGLSQYQLAARSGLSRAAINRVFRGRMSPSIDTCERIARAIGIDPREIFQARKKNRQEILTGRNR